MQNSIRVRVPQLVDIGEALLIYYSKTELSTSDIKKLFGSKAESTIWKLKSLAKKEQDLKNVSVFDNRKVNTKIAFEVWGIDIEELEKRFNKISKIRTQIEKVGGYGG